MSMLFLLPHVIAAYASALFRPGGNSDPINPADAGTETAEDKPQSPLQTIRLTRFCCISMDSLLGSHRHKGGNDVEQDERSTSSQKTFFPAKDIAQPSSH